MTQSRRKLVACGVAALVTVIAGAMAFVVRHIARPRVVARVVAPDGTEFCVVQKCNWTFELFNTSCYYRKPGGQWGWLYYDHQDSYWGTGQAVVDVAARRIIIYRGSEIAATFDWETETYHLPWQDRVITGAQEVMPVGWSVTQR